ncbi:helix-turn-helix domain-containing protein [Desulfoscipio sp. XC116]|uniref:helix-turn-helix domain-containing protein n=1 Tax=Desulfoscipio sp. XC116 TaxID=3144975 RepID=UPI00325BBD7A
MRLSNVSKHSTMKALLLILTQCRFEFEKLCLDIGVHCSLTSLKSAVEEVERQLITMALNEYKTLKQVALALKVDESTISRKIKKLSIPLR